MHYTNENMLNEVINIVNIASKDVNVYGKMTN